MVAVLIGAKLDGRAMIVEDIIDLGVKYVTNILAYKIYYQNQEGFAIAIAIYTRH